MILIAIILGAVFGGLTKIGWTWTYVGWEKADPQDAQRTRDGLLRAVYVIAIFVYLAIIIACLDAAYSYYWSLRTDGMVRLFNFMAVPTHIGIVLAFVAGVIVVWYWRGIRKFLQDFHLLPAQPATPGPVAPTAEAAIAAANAARAAGQVAEHAAAARAEANREPFPWLIRIVGIAAVTLVALVAILAFYPGLLRNLQVLKVAGVEAQFASTASNTVRVAAQATTAKAETNKNLNGWEVVGPVLIEYYARPAQTAMVNRRSNRLPLETKTPFPELDRAKDFLDRFAVPLARALSCYSNDFVVQGSQFQNRLAALAHGWASFAFQVESSKPDPDQAVESLRDRDRQTRFARLKDETDDIVQKIETDLVDRQSRCGITSSSSAYSPVAYRRDVGELGKNLSKVFSNGYVIAFISDMLMMTHRPEHVITFLEGMKPYLDQSDDNLTGRINFYYKIADVRFRYDYWKSSDANNELAHAQALVELINRAFDTSGEPICAKPSDAVGGDNRLRVQPYYCGLRVYVINLRMGNLIRDWLEGRQLSSADIEDLKIWGEELRKWITTVSVTAMYENDSGQPPWIPNIYDTLALSELALGTLENDLPATRCVRISNLLLKSKNAWAELKSVDKNFGDDANVVALHIYDAHNDLYRGACTR